MKQFQIILGLILFATVTTFAQSPRIKLNQITKDTVKGSVLISNPTDSGMVYSRDFFIAYGADTVLILYGDTLAATSGIISSVLSDGVTITGDGTSGNELKADTSVIATIKALNDSLATVSASTTPDGVTITGDGSVGNPLKVDTLLISTIQGLVDTLTARGYLTANQTITLSGDVTGSGTTAITATVVDDSHNHIISNVDNLQDSLDAKANDSELSNYLLTSNYIVDSTRLNATGDTAFYYQNGVLIGSQEIAGGGGTTYNNISETADTVFIDKFLNVDTSTLYVDATNNRVGIGTTDVRSTLTVENSYGDTSWNSAFTVNTPSDFTTVIVSSDSVRAAAYYGNSNPSATKFDFGHVNSNAVVTSRFSFTNFDNINNRSDFLIQTRGTGFSSSDAALAVLDGGNVGIGTASPSVQLELSTDGAKKLTTTTWQTGSDRRIKKNIVPYTKGLTEILRLEPIEYELNGKANTIDGAKGVGLIAQEVQPIVPEAVISYQGKLNETDENLTNLYNITTHPFFFMFINGFKEQQEIIETQASEIDQLKTLITDLTNRLTILENK